MSGSKGESSEATIERPTWRENTTEASYLILSMVKEAASVAPCKELQQAAAAALFIFQTIQAVKENKEAYKRLANDSAGIICTIWESYKAAEPPGAWLTPELRGFIKELTDTLNQIRSFVEEKLARTKLIRVIYSKADTAKITEYRERLDSASHKFLIGFQIGSHMSLHMKLGKMSEIFQDRDNEAYFNRALEISAQEARDREEAQRIDEEEQLNEAMRMSKLEQLEQSHSTEEGILELRRKLPDQDDSTASQAQAQQSTKNKKRFTEKRPKSNSVESPRRRPVALEDSVDDDEEYLSRSKMKTARQRLSSTPPHVEQTDEEEEPAPSQPRKSSKGNGKPKYPAEPPTAMNDLNAQFQGAGTPLGNSPYPPAPFPMYGFPFPPPPHGFGYGGHYPPGTVTINSGVGNVTNSTISNFGNDNSVRKVYREWRD